MTLHFVARGQKQKKPLPALPECPGRPTDELNLLAAQNLAFDGRAQYQDALSFHNMPSATCGRSIAGGSPLCDHDRNSADAARTLQFKREETVGPAAIQPFTSHGNHQLRAEFFLAACTKPRLQCCPEMPVGKAEIIAIRALARAQPVRPNARHRDRRRQSSSSIDRGCHPREWAARMATSTIACAGWPDAPASMPPWPSPSLLPPVVHVFHPPMTTHVSPSGQLRGFNKLPALRHGGIEK